MIILPAIVQKVINMLEDEGFEAYAVGGCIRDSILGKQPYDFDITTSAMPDEIEGVFRNFKTLDIGKKHGTITVFIKDNMPIEITTYRIDGEYTDSRHPNEVQFTSNLSDDLSRRDFTINAIAFNSKTGLVDLFGGIDDIKNHVIKTIGNGSERFAEDALRILRAFRFSAKLGFNIDNQTCNDILNTAELLSSISKERINSEFSKILISDNPKNTLFLMNELNVLSQILPALYNEKIDMIKTCTSIEKSESILVIRLALLFCNIDQGEEIAYQSLKSLKYDNRTIKTVTKLIKHCNIEIAEDCTSVKRWLNNISLDDFLLLLSLKKSMLLAANESIQTIENVHGITMKIINENQCYCKKDLKINGNTLIDLGIKEGKDISCFLDRLLEMVIEDNSLNKRDRLIEIVRNINS